MIHRFNRLFALFFTAIASIFYLSCQSITTMPPEFDYARISEQALHSNPGGHIPLTVQRGANKDPAITDSGFLFYTSDRDGSAQIFMRDLSNTVNVPVIQHSARQHSPSVSADGTVLAFVSLDGPGEGEIRVTDIQPEQMARASLRGTTIPNLWNRSVNLSVIIERLSNDFPPECQGHFSDRDPFVMPDGQTIYYASDRCTPGKPHIWKITSSSGRFRDPPEPVAGPGIQPSVSENGVLAFLSYEESEGGRIKIRNTDGEIYDAGLPFGTSSRPFLYQSPRLSRDGSELFYVSIRRDSNRNGILDLQDNGAIYKINLNDQRLRERRLVEESIPVHSIMPSNFLDGAILYAGELFQSINIYFSGSQGMIPRQSDIDSQFKHAETYKNEGDRYILALQSVIEFFQDDPELFLYEGRVLIKQIAASSADDPALSERRSRLRNLANENPVVRFQINENRLKQRRQATLTLYRNALNSGLPGASEEKQNLYYIYLYRGLAAEYERFNQTANALAAIRNANRYENAPRLNQSLLQEAIYESQDSLISEVFSQLLEKNPTREIRNRIFTYVYESHFDRMSPGQVLSEIERESVRSHHSQIIAALKIRKGAALMQNRNHEQAMTIVERGLETFNDTDAMYIRGWQIKADLHNRMGQYSESYQARLIYGGSYRPDSGVRIRPDEFQDIIDEAEDFIQETRVAAASILRVVNESTEQTFALLPEGVPFITAQQTVGLDVNDAETLRRFCQEGSRSRYLITTLGQPDYFTQYQQFCQQNRDLISGHSNSISMEQARHGADLLYLVSYANANILNIIFLNIKRVNLFPDLYQERAVHYNRLKTDIAIERNQKRLEWETKRTLFSRPQDIARYVTSADPFEARIFNELLHGYRMVSEEARLYGDHSLLYGYAYVLIQKSVQRESFYDEMLRAGAEISDGDLRRKKEAVLKDLKEAEYQLQYILYAEPTNIDAYLLLGWMYQYIDTRRDSPIIQSPGFIEKSFRFLTGTQPGMFTDGTYYRDVYTPYFPRRLYENNIELYARALTISDLLDIEGERKALLHLNLGNNHFQLMNFSAALDSYESAENLSRASQKGIFESHIQQALFFFNSGRAHYYEGQPEEAASRLQSAYEIYFKEEFQPENEVYAALKFESSIATGKQRNIIESRLNHSEEKLQRTYGKLGIIAALRGLALWEAGQYNDALASYELAENMLENIEHSEFNEVRINLLNFHALINQNLNNIDHSNQFANRAEEQLTELGLDKNDERFQPQTIGGRMIGFLLNYGEDFSVIGEGRNPFGFSPLRQYEMATGIQLQNQLIRGNYEIARESLTLRKNTFLRRDYDTSLGRQGYVTVLNHEADIDYRLGNFETAADLYREAAELSSDHGLLRSFTLNFKNHFHVRFAIFDRQRPDKRTAERMIADGLRDLQRFRSGIFDAVKIDYILERRTEDPGYGYNSEIDDPIVQRRVDQRISDFLSIEAGLNYYRGFFTDIHSRNENDLEQAHNYYEIALELYDQAEEALSNSPSDTVELIRLNINRARVYDGLGYHLEAFDDLEETAELAYEFGLVREQWEANYVHALLAAADPEQRYDREAGLRFRNAYQILKEHPYIRSGLANRIQDFFQFYAAFHLQRDRPDDALYYLEHAYETHLQTEFFRYSLAFPDDSRTEAHTNARNALSNLRRFSRERSSLLLQRENTGNLTQQMQSQTREFRNSARTISNSFSTYSSRQSILNPTLSNSTELVRLHANRDGLHCWRFERGQREYFFSEYGTESTRELTTRISNTLPDLLSRCINNPANLFWIVDSEIYRGNPEESFRKSFPEAHYPIYVSRMNDLFTEYIANPSDLQVSHRHLNLFNVPRPGSDDIFHINPPSGREFFRQSTVTHPSGYLMSPAQHALAISEPSNYLQIATLYDFLRLTDTGMLAVARENITEDQISDLLESAGKGRYRTEDFRLFGFPGFDASGMQNFIAQRFREANQKGRQYLEQGSFFDAAAYFQRAENLLAFLPENEARLIENRTLLFRSRQSTENPPTENAWQDLLEQSHDTDFFYLNFIEGLYESNHTEKAVDVTNKWLQERGEIPQNIIDNIVAMSFYALLQQNSLTESDMREFDTILPLLARANNRRQIIVALHKAGLLNQALSLSELSGIRNPIQRFEINLERYLLGKTDRLPTIPAGVPVYQAMVHALLSGSNRYQYLNRQNELSMHKVWILESLRKQKNENQAIDPASLVNTMESEFDRAVLFYLLTNHVEHYPDLQSARFLEQLIEVEKNETGSFRAGYMALRSANLFLDQKSPKSAIAFFRNFRENMAVARPVFLTSYASTGLWLASWGESYALNHLSEFNPPGVRDLYDFLGEARSVNSEARQFEIDIFNHPYLNNRNDLTRLLGILQQKASNAGAYAWLLNLVLYEQNINLSSENRMQVPGYEIVSKQLVETLPEGQSLTMLADTGDEIHRISLEGNQISGASINESGTTMRAYLRTHLDQLRTGHTDRTTAESLQRFYSSVLFERRSEGIHYIWMPGIHALAPLSPGRDDRIFQLLSLSEAARNEVQSLPLDYNNGFSIRTIGPYSAPTGISQEFASWITRSRRMEESILTTIRGSRGPLHIHRPLLSGLYGFPNIYFPDRHVSWFMTNLYLYDDPDREDIVYHRMTNALSRHTRAPGIIVQRQGFDHIHALFLREFYDASMTAQTIDVRYARAIASLRRKYSEIETVYSYRVVTPVFFSN